MNPFEAKEFGGRKVGRNDNGTRK